MIRGKYRFYQKCQNGVIFVLLNLPISLIFSHFQVGLFRPGSDNKQICQLYEAFRGLIMGGFGQLFGMVEFDFKRYYLKFQI